MNDRRLLPPKRGKMTFAVGGTFIQGKATMTAKCQEIMALAPWSGPDKSHHFRSQTLTDLVGNYHYFCPLFGLWPDRFRKDPPYIGFSGYTLMGHFDKVKGDGWHGVSWRKCITHPTFDSEVSDGFRRMVVRDLAHTRLEECELCGARDLPLQVDHSSPTWAKIMAPVIPLFSEEDRQTWCGFNWYEHEEFTPPEHHAAMDLFLELHRKSTLTTLCHKCHRRLTTERDTQ